MKGGGQGGGWTDASQIFEGSRWEVARWIGYPAASERGVRGSREKDADVLGRVGKRVIKTEGHGPRLQGGMDRHYTTGGYPAREEVAAGSAGLQSLTPRAYATKVFYISTGFCEGIGTLTMSLAEKGPLLTAPPATSGKQEKLIQRLKRLINFNRWLLFLAMFVALTCAGRDHISDRRTSNRDLASTRCPAQPAPLNVGIDWDPLADSIYASLAVKRLSKSVQIATESFDDLPTSPSDPAYNKFNAFHHFLRLEFPKVMSEPLKHEMVNTHGHLFTWEGSHPDLQPILLMAHSDTVPVLPDTLDQWIYPPLEGIVTVNASESTPGTWLWGRGVSDCKNQLMGILGALERLVTEEFKPERTILVASGFDEEVSPVNRMLP